MAFFGWFLWWAYTICLGLCALAVVASLIILVVMMIKKRGRWRITFKAGRFLSLLDITLLIATYVFITMLMFGGYL